MQLATQADRQRTKRIDHLLDDTIDALLGRIPARAVGLQPAERQDVLDQARQAVRLGHHDTEELVHDVRIFLAVVAQDLGRGLDRCHRRAQLVGDVRQETRLGFGRGDCTITGPCGLLFRTLGAGNRVAGSVDHHVDVHRQVAPHRVGIAEFDDRGVIPEQNPGQTGLDLPDLVAHVVDRAVLLGGRLGIRVIGLLGHWSR